MSDKSQSDAKWGATQRAGRNCMLNVVN